jgi:hypothetical protein
VLDLDVTEAVEALFVLSGDDAEGIIETKRRLGTKLILEGVQAVVVESRSRAKGGKNVDE